MSGDGRETERRYRKEEGEREGGRKRERKREGGRDKRTDQIWTKSEKKKLTIRQR